MKKFLSVILCAIMILSAMPITAGAETYNDLTYEKYDDHIEITGCDANAESVNIPAEIDGLPVTSIGDNAFAFLDSLTNVTIPSSVTSIGFGAFLRCESLTSITVPSGVTRIGSGAFHNTAYYNEDSNWQNGVLYIDNCLIEAKGDELSSNYTINSGTRVIADEAFLWCENLTSVVIPNSVTNIGYGVFAGCEGLTNVKIPNSVTSISPSAFNSCGNLNITVDERNPNYCDIDGVLFNKGKTEIMAYSKDKIQPEYSIPDSVTSIGDYAFRECRGITSVTIPESVTSIGKGAFGFCTGLAGITIPGSVTSIGDSAFEDCGSLMSITIPSSVIDIGDYAFVSCNSLTSVTIENGVTSIGDRAFEWCDSLTDVYYTGSEEQWKNIIMGYGNDCLTSATIHYNSDGHPQISVSEPMVEGGSITITAETKNIEDEGELFAVGYDGSKLTASEKLQDGAATLPAEDVQTIKVFCWDSLDTMRPLCEPKTITIK